MRICFVMPHHWSSTLGGAELQVRYIIKYIQERTPHEAFMICCSTRLAIDNGIAIYQSRPCIPIRRYSLAADYFSVRRLLRKLAPDIVYTRTSTPLVGFAARFCVQENKRLVYHIAHVSDVEPPREGGRRALLKKLERPIYEYGLRRANIVVAQAQYQKTLLYKNYGINANAVIPNFHPFPEVSEKAQNLRQVLWVANLKKAKRPEVFVELARRLGHLENTEFIMVGAVQDPAYNSLLVRATDLGNFRYLGPLSIEDVNRRLAAANIFVNTSRADGEGFPNTFIQSWLRSVPVISLDCDPDSILEAHAVGTQCGGCFEKMVDTVEALVLDNAKRQILGKNASKFAVENFGEANCRELVTLITSY